MHTPALPRSASLALLLLGSAALAGCAHAQRGTPGPRPYEPAERSAWIAPTRWGLDGHLEPAVDRAELGPRALYLAFDPIPAAERALLVVTPLERGTAVLVVARTSDGVELARVPIDGAGPAWIDLPVAPRHQLAIRAEGTIAIATPLHAEHRARPRLELTLAPAGAAPADTAPPGAAPTAVSTAAAR